MNTPFHAFLQFRRELPSRCP